MLNFEESFKRIIPDTELFKNNSVNVDYRKLIWFLRAY